MASWLAISALTAPTDRSCGMFSLVGSSAASVVHGHAKEGGAARHLAAAHVEPPAEVLLHHRLGARAVLAAAGGRRADAVLPVHLAQAEELLSRDVLVDVDLE